MKSKSFFISGGLSLLAGVAIIGTQTNCQTDGGGDANGSDNGVPPLPTGAANAQKTTRGKKPGRPPAIDTKTKKS